MGQLDTQSQALRTWLQPLQTSKGFYGSLPGPAITFAVFMVFCVQLHFVFLSAQATFSLRSGQTLHAFQAEKGTLFA